MIGRLIYKLILALSLLLGISLLIPWSRTRHSDLLISGASGGTYRELRLGDSQLGVTLITTWPDDEHVTWGRARHPAPTAPDEPPLTQPPPALESLALFDGAVVMLEPDRAPWWPPMRTSGAARMSEVTIKHMIRPRTIRTGQSRSRQISSHPTLIVAYTYERYALPIWAVAAVVLIPVWWTILIALLRWRRRRSRRRRGLCERCGYDLRGNPAGSACSECGAASDTIPAPPSGEQLIARLK